jgi:L-amino acid N-acyltransferase YncA
MVRVGSQDPLDRVEQDEGLDQSSMDVEIRDVVPSDAEGIVGILNPIIAARLYTAFDAPFSPDDERDYIIRFPPRGVWKVALQGSSGPVIGFQTLEPFGAYTRAFDHVGTLGTYVDLQQRRQGVGTALFAATFEAAWAKGYEKIFTFVRADNPGALAAYRAHGFEVIGTARRHAKIDGRYIDEILIEKALVPV